jgi:hypothetical protein
MKAKIISLILATCLIASLAKLFFLKMELIEKKLHIMQCHTFKIDHGPRAVVRFPKLRCKEDFKFGEMADLIRALSHMGLDMNINGFYYSSPFVRTADGESNVTPFLEGYNQGETCGSELVLTCQTTEHRCTYDNNKFYWRAHPVQYDTSQFTDWINKIEKRSHVSIWADYNTSFRSLAEITNLLRKRGMEVAFVEPTIQTNQQEHIEVRIRVDSPPSPNAPWGIPVKF